MKKKEYERPQMEVIEMQKSAPLVCNSPGGGGGGMPPGQDPEGF